MSPVPPLGAPSDAQRRCMRQVGYTADSSEVLCEAPAIQHIIWWWREQLEGENMDDCWDHGFACPMHWAEMAKRGWTFAAAHAVTPACGMPGSQCSFEQNTCFFGDLPTAEPDRVVAIGLEVPA